MKYIFDFDDTLFDQTRFKRHIYTVVEAKTGIPADQVEKKYQKVRGGLFSLKEFIANFLAANPRKSLGTSMGEIYDEIMEKCPVFVNKELLAEIEKLPKEDLWIMTYGEEEFNRAKVEQSGIGKFFNKVQIRVVSGSKKEWVAQTCAEFPEEIIIFVDNRQDFIQEVTREKSKNLRTILYDENGLQKFREAIQQGVT